MKLELKHLAPYLPYGLNVWSIKFEKEWILEELYKEGYPYWDCTETEIMEFVPYGDVIKPILRPLSDLNENIEVNGKKVNVLIELLRESNFDVDNMTINQVRSYENSFKEVEFISLHELHIYLQYHFDVFGLIEKGLAIDINTLKK